MSRIFSLNINYQSKEYLTLVTEQHFADDTFFIVRYVDNKLKKIIPEDHVLFNHNGELKKPIDIKNAQASLLLKSTSDAITQYLKQEKV